MWKIENDGFHEEKNNDYASSIYTPKNLLTTCKTIITPMLIVHLILRNEDEAAK
jgi:hypothetical protein